MMPATVSSLDQKLSKTTSFFSLKLWILVIACIVVFIILVITLLLLLSLCFISRRGRKSSRAHFSCASTTAPSLDRRLLSRNGADIEINSERIEMPVQFSRQWSLPASGLSRNFTDLGNLAVWDKKEGKQRYTPREIEVATNGFGYENVIGCGDCGIVYRGVLFDGTRVAVKKLLYNSGKVEDFIELVEEAIGYARHKNLVKLLGYSIEGASRMLVYEYVDNKDLYQWLHRCIRPVSPLTWNIRMNIIQSAAKGLAYLHEDIEPKIIHQHIKSSNILLDHQWNPKISDHGIAEVLDAEWSHFANSSIGMRGYIAPEYAYTGVFDEKSEVYSFGILLMEIITGKTPVEYYAETKTEVYLVDWFKSMVAEQNFDQIVDSKMREKPPLKEFKRIILIALRCVDPDAENRPTMGEVIHMFDPLDLLLTDEGCIRHKSSRCNSLRGNHPASRRSEVA